MNEVLVKTLHYLDSRRPQRDEEERREDKEHQREDKFYGCLRRLFFDLLTTLGSERIGMNS